MNRETVEDGLGVGVGENVSGVLWGAEGAGDGAVHRDIFFILFPLSFQCTEQVLSPCFDPAPHTPLSRGYRR